MKKADSQNEKAMKAVMNFLRIGKYLDRTGNRIVGEFKLNQQQFAVLNEIGSNGEMTQKMLVGNLLYEKSNVSKIVKKLKTLGYIDVSPSSEDGRVSIIHLKPEGEFVWRQCLKKFHAWNRDWIKPLTEAELTQVYKIHEQLMKAQKQGLG